MSSKIKISFIIVLAISFTVINAEQDSPRKQFSSGIPLHEIDCRNDLVLVLKLTDLSPNCVRTSSVEQLINLSWAANIDTQNEKLHESRENTILTNSPIFKDITMESGITFNHTSDESYTNIGAGVAVIDFDKDGFDDIFLTNSIGSNALYHNNGDLTFSDIAKKVGLDDPDGSSTGVCFADYDNDNDLDLFVTGYGTSKLYENMENESFVDVTYQSNTGDPDSTFRSTGCAWGDYDDDGFLDLIVTRWITQSDEDPFAFTTRDFSQVTRPVHLFHNSGDGTFVLVTHLLGDTKISPSNVNGAGFQPSFFDFDNDNDLDIIVVNDFGKEHQPTTLWRNDGSTSEDSWKFTDVSEQTGVDVEIFAMGIAIGDYNNDGFLDLYLTNMGDNVLLQNTGKNSFNDKTDFANVFAGILNSNSEETSFVKKYGHLKMGMGMHIPVEMTSAVVKELEEMHENMPVGWGTLFFDYNNDGFLDLYTVRGFMTDTNPMAKLEPNVLFQNNGDETFSDVSAISGLNDPGYGRGTAYGDFNNDGCVDIYVANIDQRGKLFLNNCDWENNFLIIKTTGTLSNNDGIGTRIKVVTDSGTFIREVRSGESHLSQNTFSVHFGLGKEDKVSLIQIFWPSGQIQEIRDVVSNQIISVTEKT